MRICNAPTLLKLIESLDNYRQMVHDKFANYHHGQEHPPSELPDRREALFYDEVHKRLSPNAQRVLLSSSSFISAPAYRASVEPRRREEMISHAVKMLEIEAHKMRDMMHLYPEL